MSSCHSNGVMRNNGTDFLHMAKNPSGPEQIDVDRADGIDSFKNMRIGAAPQRTQVPEQEATTGRTLELLLRSKSLVPNICPFPLIIRWINQPADP